MEEKKLPAKNIYKRSFLNSTKGSAAIEIVSTLYDTNIADANIKITDCNHTVNLDFTFSTNKDRKLKLAKLDKLINELEYAKERIFV